MNKTINIALALIAPMVIVWAVYIPASIIAGGYWNLPPWTFAVASLVWAPAVVGFVILEICHITERYKR